MRESFNREYYRSEILPEDTNFKNHVDNRRASDLRQAPNALLHTRV